MIDSDEERLERKIDRLQRRLPDRLGRFVQWLRKPSSRWFRIPLGIVLVVAGIFSVLPVLGLWMLPLGLLLLSLDVPLLKRPILATLDWFERHWRRWRMSRRRGPP